MCLGPVGFGFRCRVQGLCMGVYCNPETPNSPNEGGHYL